MFLPLVRIEHKVFQVLLFFIFIQIKLCCLPCDCVNGRLTCSGLDIISFPSVPDLIADELTRIEIYNTRITCLEPVQYGFQYVKYFIEEQNRSLNCSCLKTFVESLSQMVIVKTNCSYETTTVSFSSSSSSSSSTSSSSSSSSSSLTTHIPQTTSTFDLTTCTTANRGGAVHLMIWILIITSSVLVLTGILICIVKYGVRRVNGNHDNLEMSNFTLGTYDLESEENIIYERDIEV